MNNIIKQKEEKKKKEMKMKKMDKISNKRANL